jgi:hypothetical protein
MYLDLKKLSYDAKVHIHYEEVERGKFFIPSTIKLTINVIIIVNSRAAIDPKLIELYHLL